MNLKIDLMVVLLYLASVQGAVQNQGRVNPPPRGDNRVPAPGNRYKYSVHLGENVTVEIGAFVPEDQQNIFITSFDPALTEHNISRTGTFYFFNGNTPLYVIQGGKGPCYVGDTELTYAGITTELEHRNQTTLLLGKDEVLDATHGPLSQDDADVLIAANPGIRLACGFRPIVRLADSSGSLEEDTAHLKALTFDNEVRLLVAESP